MPDSRPFEEQKTDAMEQIALKPDTYMVSVLRAHAESGYAKTNPQYAWFRCSERTTIKNIQEKYYLEMAMPGDDFVFRHQAKILNDFTTISELDAINDHLVVLEAVAKQELKDHASVGQCADNHGTVQSSSSPHQSAAPYPTLPEGRQKEIQTMQLQKVIQCAPPYVLEVGVKEGVKLLKQLDLPMSLKSADNRDVGEWVKRINRLIAKASPTRTVVGVVGNTGAGKSSIINALLDEERVVPTNCMRACTAVITEVSYSYEDIPYRAIIEFIKRSEWEKELRVLFQDLFDSDGNISRDCANQDSDAGVAFAKIRAVYPTKSKEELAKTSIESLLQEVSHLLDNSIRVEERKAPHFYKELQKMIDSKERTRGRKQKAEQAEQMGYWPLIKVVRLYLKSPVLSTGMILVDLPGTHDSNVARAAVADKYMKETSAIWIVTPITRAVDDKTASVLLGESFKRQLRLDGGLGSITFVCSKTDDISNTEAQDSLGLEDQVSPLEERSEELRSEHRSLGTELDEKVNSLAHFNEIVNDLDDQVELWQDLLKDVLAGKDVFAPKPKTSQKRRVEQRERPNKRRCPSSQSETDSESEVTTPNSPTEVFEREDVLGGTMDLPLTVGDITVKIAELSEEKKEARHAKSEVEDSIKRIQMKQEEIIKGRQAIEAKITTICILGRNRCVTEIVQQDYAALIKDMDQEIAAEDDDDFNPDCDARDYTKVAQDLPVFCVSARGYQSLKGRLRKDRAVNCFQKLRDTGVPMLQQHCIKLTESGRIANCRRFLNSLLQFLNSLALWTSSDSLGIELTEEQRAIQAQNLAASMAKLGTYFRNIVRNIAEELRAEISKSIFDRFGLAVESAASQATSTTLHWAMPINKHDRGESGFHWSTYKALCRREGVYSSKTKQQLYNWNAALAAPMLEKIFPGWEKMFGRRLTTIMSSFAKSAFEVLTDCHREIDREARRLGVTDGGLRLLQRQIGGFSTILKAHATTVQEAIRSEQKNINREFVPVIQKALIPVYAACAKDHGTGSFARMKSAMDAHIKDNRYSMFQNSADKAQQSLLTLIDAQEKSLAEKVEEVLEAVQRDCTSVLIGGQILGEAKLRETRQNLRQEVVEVLSTSELIFRRVNDLSMTCTDIIDIGEDEFNASVHGNSRQAPGGKELQLISIAGPAAAAGGSQNDLGMRASNVDDVAMLDVTQASTELAASPAVQGAPDTPRSTFSGPIGHGTYSADRAL